MTKRRYHGSCHCGAQMFEFSSEEISEGRRCNCSICVRKGAVMSAVYIPTEDFDAKLDRTVLGAYRWNDEVVDHLFCTRCGIYPFHGDDDMGYRVNLGCVEELDIMTLSVSIIDGRSMPVRQPPG